MAEITETITDILIMEEKFTKAFLGKNAFLKTGETNTVVKFLGVKNGVVFVDCSLGCAISENTLLFIRENETVVCAKVQIINRQNENIIAFRPLNIQLINAPRKEGRSKLSNAGSNLYISNILSDYNIFDSLVRNKRQIDLLSNRFLENLEKSYNSCFINFLSGKTTDVRMNYFLSKRKPLHIIDVHKQFENPEEEKFLNYYKIAIFNKDKNFMNNKIISEASIPILYKGLLPIGYIQVNDIKQITEEDFNSIKRLGISASDLFSNKDIMLQFNEKITVDDVSASGIGIIFEDRIQLRYFKDNAYLYLAIFLPENKIISMLCMVRNINIIGNNKYRVGIQIVELDAIGEVFYMEFIESTVEKK